MSFTMVKQVYWTTTPPVTILIGGIPTNFIFLRFGVTGTGQAQDRVNQWKNYCPLAVTLAGSIQSVHVISGQPDDAIRRSAVVPLRLLFRLSNESVDCPSIRISSIRLPRRGPSTCLNLAPRQIGLFSPRHRMVILLAYWYKRNQCDGWRRSFGRCKHTRFRYSNVQHDQSLSRRISRWRKGLEGAGERGWDLPYHLRFVRRGMQRPAELRGAVRPPNAVAE